ncbi:MAG: hypothetical protein R3C11_28320 [Planctomycetaceae bacterium]
MKNSEILQHRIGETIKRLSIELWTDDSTTFNTPVSVIIELENGKPFILACAGDGGISIRKGIPESTNQELRAHILNQFNGAILKSVITSQNGLLISTADHHLEIINNDDQLELILDDSPAWSFRP